jgi:hypothetical protein
MYLEIIERTKHNAALWSFKIGSDDGMELFTQHFQRKGEDLLVARDSLAFPDKNWNR